jgi:uncharacterized protein
MMFKKRLLILLGTLSLGLGILGIFLPVLPTTPFLLLTAYCYLRGSETFYARLMNHRILGSYIKNYLEYRAISARAKAVSIIGLWVSLTASLILVALPVVRLVLVAVGIGVSAHLLILKTLPNEAREAARENRAADDP